ncbi:MAG: murein biosynthesis integral membrane protein MurJ [Cardiobacteriaceae bacterium]|nr:murein biosynthesis integral membrane protein MurJ [Cardiobacteriaceae bacterium]
MAGEKTRRTAALGRSSLVFSVMTLLSRILGLLRDMLVARYFDSSITDPFFAALRIPNTLRRFFAEGGFANAFVPVFSATRAESPQKVRDLLAHTTGTLMTVLLAVTVIGVIFAGSIVFAVAYGLVEKPAQYLLATDMLRIMFPYIFLISLTALAGGVLNTYGRFAVPALTPVLLNVTLILACLWRAQAGEASTLAYGMELAWAVLLGGILQLAIQIPFLARLGLLVWPRWGWRHGGVRRIMRLMLPTLFGSSVGQLSVLVNTFLASLLATGSISWLYYSDRMVELPVALIGVALGTVILPRLSALKASDDWQRFYVTLDWALRWGLLVGSAAATGLVVLAPSILATLFYGGVFDAQDWLMTTQALRAYGIGAFFLIMVKVLAPAFYARHDTKTPVKAGISAMLANMVAALVLGHFFAHVGLALASTVAAIVNMMLLLLFLQRDGVRIKLFSLLYLAQLLMANGAMACVLLWLQGDTALWLGYSSLQQMLQLALIIMTGVITFAAALYAMGINFRQLRLRMK